MARTKEQCVRDACEKYCRRVDPNFVCIYPDHEKHCPGACKPECDIGLADFEREQLSAGDMTYAGDAGKAP